MSAILERPVRTEVKTCASCQAPFTIEFDTTLPLSMRGFLARRTLCDTCAAEDDQKRRDQENLERIASRQAVREAAWAKICPPIYAATDPKLLPRPQLFSRVMEWKHGPKGLLLHGETRLGKSRIAWMLMRREFDAGRSIGVLNATAALRYAAAFGRSCEEAENWFDDRGGKDILFLDDVFKSKLSDSFEQALFGLAEQRSAYMRPVVATCNDTAKTLASRLSNDRGPALIGRLLEFSEAITFA
jgi:DNA replication protein DnaC